MEVLKDEIDLIKATDKFFTKKGFEFRYMAKSKSMNNKLTALESENICVLRSQLPVELYILEEIKAGRNLSIVSIGSTAIRVLSNINADIDIYGIELDCEFMTKEMDRLERIAISEYFKKEPRLNILKYSRELSEIID